MAALLMGVVLGLWLMASPAVLHYAGTARIGALVAGPIAASVSWIALSEVTRPVRRFNVVVGLWLVLTAFLFQQPRSAAINAIAVGLLLGTIAFRPTRIAGRYGGGWRALIGRGKPRVRRAARSVVMPEFMFATGIENSYPTIGLPNGTTYRVDEMAKTGHYEHWREDFQLVKEMGIEHLRYGPPYYRCHLGPGRYDWSFADETFTALRDMGITPIADLCHFGVPDWIGNFQNPDWPGYFAEYARAFATRFPWVKLYTPANEIFVAATFSAQFGWWNERLANDRAFVVAIKHLCQANVLAMKAIIDCRPDATFVQSEASQYYHAEDPACEPLADFLNQKRFLSLDLTYGYPISVNVYEYLLDNGMSREEYHWFGKHQVKAHCVMGTDYYITNEHLVHSDGTVSDAGDLFGYYVLTRQYFSRYRLPVMHTETNYRAPKAVPWLRKQWTNAVELKQEGVPIVGFTWYSLTDQVDWDSALRENAGKVNPLGLYDLDRKIRPVGKAYRDLIREWKEILPTGSLALTLGY